MSNLSDLIPIGGGSGSGGKLRYQEFTSSGVFTPSAKLVANGGQCWALLVGGGGGGGFGRSYDGLAGNGYGDGAGGGGGGVQVVTMTLTSPVSVIVGAGGAGGASETAASGATGGTTYVGPYAVTGGGGGGGTNKVLGATADYTGKPGACGGGSVTNVQPSAGSGGGGGMGGPPPGANASLGGGLHLWGRPGLTVLQPHRRASGLAMVATVCSDLEVAAGPDQTEKGRVVAATVELRS